MGSVSEPVQEHEQKEKGKKSRAVVMMKKMK